MKNKTRFDNAFYFKYHIPNDLTSGVAYKFQFGSFNKSYYDECVRHLNVRNREYIGVSPLTKKQVKSKNRSLGNHSLFLNTKYSTMIMLP